MILLGIFMWAVFDHHPIVAILIILRMLCDD